MQVRWWHARRSGVARNVARTIDLKEHASSSFVFVFATSYAQSPMSYLLNKNRTPTVGWHILHYIA
jgi:hypothetical protein